MSNNEDNNWEEISNDISEISKKVNNNINKNESFDDLKDSFREVVENTSNILKGLMDALENTIKDEDDNGNR